jgi:enoyl-CoA hydratase
MGNAAFMILTGDPVPVSRALSMGLIAETTPPGGASVRAVEIAQRIAQRSPSAVRAAKAALRAGQDKGLAEGLSAERRAFEAAFASPDRTEGIAAFLERRQPRFAGDDV